MESKGPLAIFSGVSIDLFSDGVMIGTGTVINPPWDSSSHSGRYPQTSGEGFAAVATLRRANIARRTRILMALSCTIPIAVGAILGYFALRDAPELLTLVALRVALGSTVLCGERGATAGRWS